MKKNRLIKELSIGVASLALVAPLVLDGMQSTPVHAESLAQLYRVYNKEQSEIPKSEIRQRKREIHASNASEQRYEQNLIRRDPSTAGMYAFEPDNSAKTKILIRETLIKHPKLFAKDTDILNKYHVKYRYARHSNHRRTHAKKHIARKHDHRASHRRHGGRVSVAQTLASMKKSEDNTPASAKAQSAKLGNELEKTEDKNEIHLVRTDPGEAYIDAQDMKSLQPSVRAVVKRVYPRDVRKGLVPQLNGRYLRRHHVRKHARYSHVNKHGKRSRRTHTKKHVNKKRSHRKSHKVTKSVR